MITAMQVIIEIPYVFVQTTYYTLIVYAMVSFEWKAIKFFWFFFSNFFSFLYFTYYGMMTVSATPNLQAAAVFSNAFYYLFNLFSGFFIPGPVSDRTLSRKNTKLATLMDCNKLTKFSFLEKNGRKFQNGGFGTTGSVRWRGRFTA